MAQHVIWRIEKLKQRGRINASHAARTSTGHPAPHADPKGRIERLLWPDAPTLADAVDARIEQAGVKPRKNSVRAVEFVLSASPEWFRPEDPSAAGTWRQDRLDAWRDRALDVLRQEFGDRLLSAELHLDESTPHIQGVIVPITEDGRLCARDMFGRDQLRKQQQKTIGRAFEDLGLQPGISGSQARHIRVRQFYAAANQRIDMPRVDVPPLNVRESARQEWAKEQTRQVRRQTKAAREEARRTQIAERKAKQHYATAERVAKERDQARDEAKRLAAQVRDVPLESVLAEAGWDRDPEDRSQWIAPAGVDAGRISISGVKWFDHAAEVGGGKAIDLAKHLLDADFQGAVAWLAERHGVGQAAGAVAAASREAVAEAQAERKPLQVPAPAPEQWPRVREYLTQQRGIKGPVVDALHQAGRIWADAKANVVAAMRDRAGAVRGAELRGTGAKRFQALAPGSDRNRSAFALNVPAPDRSKGGPVVLVESAVDAMSYAQLHAGDGPFVVTSTAGARPRPPHWVGEREVVVAYDADPEGDRCADRLIAEHGARRDRPTAGTDWNDQLLAAADTGEGEEARADADHQSPSPG